VRIENASGAALHANGGSIDVADSLILVPQGATALRSSSRSGTGASTIANRLTVAALPGATQTRGVDLHSTHSGQQVWAWVKNSAFVGIGRPLVCEETSGQTLNTFEYMYRPADSGSDAAACDKFDANAITGDPKFVDPAAGDYHLRPGSSLIDHAEAADPTDTDLDGLQRGIDGNGTDGGATDVGAYEYGRRQPSAIASVNPQTVTARAPATFTAVGADPDPGDTLSYSWSFEDGPSAAGASATRSFATPGVYTATVTVTDPAGRFTEATATVTVVPADQKKPDDAGDDKPPPPNDNGPPNDGQDRDTTAPLVTGLVVRKKAGRAAFALSEPATVTVRLQRRGAKKRYVAAGKAATIAGKLGPNTVKLARLKKSGPGRYRLTAVAVDAAGNRSAPARIAFKVKRGRCRRCG
jgi:hypothetical protein